MKRLLVSMDEERYEALRRLAFERKKPMAELVRYAVERTFEDDIDGILGQMALEEHLKDPSGSVTIEELMEEYGLVSRRGVEKGKTRSRRVAS